MMSEDDRKINKKGILEQLYELIEQVEDAYNTGQAAHKVEQDIFSGLLKVGYLLLSYLFALYEAEDLGESIELSDGRKVKRLPKKHKRSYLSIFGEFSLYRWVYGTREGQKVDYILMDKKLQLPQSK